MTEVVNWLAEFMENERQMPGNSCSCSKDCDRERTAAFIEIVSLRNTWWHRLRKRLKR